MEICQKNFESEMEEYNNCFKIDFSHFKLFENDYINHSLIKNINNDNETKKDNFIVDEYFDI